MYHSTRKQEWFRCSQYSETVYLNMKNVPNVPKMSKCTKRSRNEEAVHVHNQNAVQIVYGTKKKHRIVSKNRKEGPVLKKIYPN